MKKIMQKKQKIHQHYHHSIKCPSPHELQTYRKLGFEFFASLCLNIAHSFLSSFSVYYNLSRCTMRSKIWRCCSVNGRKSYRCFFIILSAQDQNKVFFVSWKDYVMLQHADESFGHCYPQFRTSCFNSFTFKPKRARENQVF